MAESEMHLSPSQKRGILEALPWTRRWMFGAVVLLPLMMGACGTTLRVASHSDIKDIDPIWTTAYVTRNHGYLIYDTLFAMDSDFKPQPEMVDSWTVSPDQKTWTFKLRDGLKWHDGTSVTADDCVASLQRWGKRDGMGQQLFDNFDSLTAADAKTIVMKLKAPDDLVLPSLAKLSSNVPFMMPKRIAGTDPFKPITDPIGSGPFIFKKDEWVPGSKAVYVKNPDYLARSEPPSLAAGGKVAKVDRIEMIYSPDANAAVQALKEGKIDYMEAVPTKLVPTLEADKNVRVGFTDPIGNIGMVRFNSLQPPFDKAGVRRAVLMGLKQQDYMTAALGDQKFWRTCYSVFPCGTSLANETGSEVMKTGNLDAAKKALQAAGYDGTPVVILNPSDNPVLAAFTQVTVDTLRNIGVKVDVQDMTWATLLERRTNRGPVSQGGWNMFHTWWIAADLMDPTAIAFSGNPQEGWYGWPKDEELERDRIAYAKARTVDEKRAAATKVQQRLWAIGAFGILGQFFEPVAYRTNITGITTTIQFYWNVKKQ